MNYSLSTIPIGLKRAIQARGFACILIYIAFVCLLNGAAQQSTLATTRASSGKKASNPVPARNTEAGGRYVGSKVCASCHSNIYSSFRQTSMGMSMLPGDANSLASVLPLPATVYDKDSNQYFDVMRRDGGLFQSQYALDADGKELFRQSWKVDYDIGAGANGFGFLIQRDHYLFEAPLSYYTKTHSWGFAPGFEVQNRGFTRPILGRCITCHSGRPNPVAGQVGLYKDPPFDELAVGCENCHGPGELHLLRVPTRALSIRRGCQDGWPTTFVCDATRGKMCGSKCQGKTYGTFVPECHWLIMFPFSRLRRKLAQSPPPCRWNITLG